MRIKMLRTQAGSLDGVRIDTYQSGAEYDMGKSDKHIELANIFISERWAEQVISTPTSIPEQNQEISNPVKSLDPRIKVKRKFK